VPELRQHKWEIFARFLADDHSQSESYELSGYRPSTANASTLANRPEIQQRVRELKEEKLQREAELQTRLKALNIDPNSPDDLALAQDEVIEWTVQKVCQELWKNARLAQAQNEFGAANKSLELIGKAIGMWEDHKKAKDGDGNGKTQIGIALIGQALDGVAITDGRGSTQTLSPLAPRLPSAADAERVARPSSPTDSAGRSD
jgi:hypothetical protein